MLGYNISNITPLVAVQCLGKCWVVFGNWRLKALKDSTGLRHIRRPLNLSGLVAFAALGKPLGGNVDASDGLACALLGIANL